MTKSAFTITVYDRTVGPTPLNEVAALYREVYAEPPYLESEGDFASFAEDLPKRAQQESFRLVIARLESEPLGIALGHRLPARTLWWDGAVSPLTHEVTAERPGRTFAVIELAVRQSHRRAGVGGLLHAHLTVNLSEERKTLLVRPDARAAQVAYSRWGYRKIGEIKPYADAPTYDAMLLE